MSLLKCSQRFSIRFETENGKQNIPTFENIAAGKKRISVGSFKLDCL